jgi:ABC-type multidrug transport system permease subunit
MIFLCRFIYDVHTKKYIYAGKERKTAIITIMHVALIMMGFYLKCHSVLQSCNFLPSNELILIFFSFKRNKIVIFWLSWLYFFLSYTFLLSSLMSNSNSTTVMCLFNYIMLFSLSCCCSFFYLKLHEFKGSQHPSCAPHYNNNDDDDYDDNKNNKFERN